MMRRWSTTSYLSTQSDGEALGLYWSGLSVPCSGHLLHDVVREVTVFELHHWVGAALLPLHDLDLLLLPVVLNLAGGH